MDNKSYYDTFATTYEDQRHHGYHRFLDEAEVGLVAPLVRGGDVLEVGCGTGLILERLQRVARRAVGVDLSPGMLEHAKARGLEVQEGDATALPFDDASFDVTCSFKVLAHVPDLAKALAEMARVTRPGGAVVAELYNKRSIRALVKRLKPKDAIGKDGEATDADVYTRYDSLKELKRALPAGTRLERVDGIRIAAPVAAAFNLPVVGRAVEASERLLMRTPLRHFGGFLVLTLRVS